MKKQQTFKFAALGALGMLLAASPFAKDAMAEDEIADARIYYKDGTRLEFEDASIKLNAQIQPRYTYEDRSQKDREQAGFPGGEDSSSFRLRRGRLALSGHVLDKQFSFKLQNDFASDSGKGQMKDMWIQWNGDDLNVRFGQYKVPFTRQERTSSTSLYFVDRSLVNEAFTYGRDTGIQASTTLGGLVNIASGIFNGNSIGEGAGRPGVDPRVNWATAADFTTENYGSRGVEGDLRDDCDFGATIGGAVVYGDGKNTFDEDIMPATVFTQTALNANAGLRMSGFDLQGEYIWQQVDFDNSSTKLENDGFYLQLSYTVDKLGFGYRYGYINLDDDTEEVIDSLQEHSVVFNYFINGHLLKLQNSVTWELAEVTTGTDDIHDFRYVLQLAAMF